MCLLNNFGANIYKLTVQIVAILLEDTNQLDTQTWISVAPWTQALVTTICPW